MHRIHKTFIKTKKGKEHYLRDDLPCFSELCSECALFGNGNTLSSDPFNNTYLILDEEAAFRQLDLLEIENPAITNIIILETVLESIRIRNLSIYNRIRNLINTPSKHFILFSNEHNKDTYVDYSSQDSIEIRKWKCYNRALEWYMNHLQDKCDFLLIVQSKEHIPSFIDMNKVKTVKEFVTSLNTPQLLDHIYDPLDSTTTTTNTTDNNNENNNLYPDYYNDSVIQQGLREKKLFQGCYRANPDYWMEGRVTINGFNNNNNSNNSKDEPTTILIQSLKHINRAIDGDNVVIEILPKSQWKKPCTLVVTNDSDNINDDDENVDEIITNTPEKNNQNQMEIDDNSIENEDEEELKPTGKVVGIIKRNWRPYCGSISVDNNKILHGQWSMFIPVDRKIPRIRFRTSQRESLLNQRLIVVIDEWPVNSKYPIGHYTETLGEIGTKDTETNVILLEHNTPTKAFSPAVISCLPPKNWKITPENSKGRLDIRNTHIVCSIDPPGCKDIDDALSARRLENGNVEIGVHIADVSYYVRPGNALDLEAADRSTTTYLVERRLDMLPGLLTETLCSLVGGEDRFAFSVFWEMNEKTGEIIKSSFHKTILRSKIALTYAAAQAIIDDPNVPLEQKDLRESLIILLNISKILKQKRIDAGALSLASPEVRFELDSETHDPLNIESYQHKDTNSLVEEFMLLANCTVARKIYNTYPNYAILRRHPIPDPKRFDDFKALALAEGFTLNTDSNKQLAESLDKAVKPDDPYFNTLIRIMATRCLTQAEYFCSGEHSEQDFLHYGLAAPIYTHFTSPIRRYSDVMVHRLLASAIGVESLPELYQDKDYLHKITQNMNNRHLHAQLAGRESVELYTKLYFKEAKSERAIIMRCKANGLIVIVPRYGLEGVVYLSKEGEKSKYNFDSKKKLLINKNDSSDILRPFLPILVRISVEEKPGARHELTLSLDNDRNRAKRSNEVEDDKMVKKTKRN